MQHSSGCEIMMTTLAVTFSSSWLVGYQSKLKPKRADIQVPSVINFSLSSRQESSRLPSMSR